MPLALRVPELPSVPPRVRRVAPVAAVTLGTALTLVLARAFAVSMMFVYGDPGATDAVRLGLVGLLPFGLAVASVPWVAAFGATRSARWLAVAVVACRLALQATDGGGGQLAAAVIGLFAALTWLIAIAGGAVHRVHAGVGVAAGIAVDAAIHAALDGSGLAWRDGSVAWLVVIVGVALYLVTVWSSDIQEQTDGSSPGWPWALVGPVLALHLVVGDVGRIRAVTGTADVGATLFAVVGPFAGLGLVLLAVRRPDRLVGTGAAALALVGLAVTTAGMPFESPPWSAVGHVALVIGVTAAVGCVGWAAGSASPVRRALAAAGGLLAIPAGAFSYYATFDLDVAWSPSVVVAALVVLVAVVVALARPGEDRPTDWLLIGGAVAVLAAGTVVAAALRPEVATAEPGTYPVRVLTYNVHMGVGLDGRPDVSAIARVVGEADADVIVLNEVSRGWFIAGGADVLHRLARIVGLPYVFAPAADEAWGNAILSRYPLVDVRVDVLPVGGATMRRSAVSAAVQLRTGQLGVVGTHLHHVPQDVETRRAQAERVAQIADEFVRAGVPVVVAGDLNAPPDTEDLAPLDGWTFATAGAPPTYPADRPVEHLDHVLLSPELEAAGVDVIETVASDHRPVLVTVLPADR